MTELKTALDDLVRDVTVSAGTVGEVRRRRARRRTRLIAGLSVLVVAAAGSGYALRPGHSRASIVADEAPPLWVIDGAPVTYLPPGFAENLPRFHSQYFYDEPGTPGPSFGEAFQGPDVGPANPDGSRLVNELSIVVQRGPDTLAAAVATTRDSGARQAGGAANVTVAQRSVRGHDASLIGFGRFETLVWVPAPDLTLSVTVVAGFVPDDELLKVANGIGDTETPAQPADPDAARAAVTRAFETAFGPGTRAERLAAVERGDAIAAVPPANGEAQLGRAPVRAPVAGGHIAFPDATTAYLTFTASHLNSDGSSPEVGIAVYVDGGWRVQEQTWCGDVNLSPCP